MTLTAGWRRLARALWPAVVLLGGPQALPAQIPDWLAAGHRVLILRKTDGPMITGVITSHRGDSITVAEGAGETRLAGADIAQLDVSRPGEQEDWIEKRGY